MHFHRTLKHCNSRYDEDLLLLSFQSTLLLAPCRCRYFVVIVVVFRIVRNFAPLALISTRPRLALLLLLLVYDYCCPLDDLYPVSFAPVGKYFRRRIMFTVAKKNILSYHHITHSIAQIKYNIFRWLLLLGTRFSQAQ